MRAAFEARPHGDMGLSYCGERETESVNHLFTGGWMAVGWVKPTVAQWWVSPTLPSGGEV